MSKVYFIGAGPGDPELLTVKAKKIIEQADVIIYADSLVNPTVCSGARRDADIYPSSSLTLEEITGIISSAVDAGKTVARLQTGDPAVYGAIYEQMDALDEKGIDYEVIPGVSSMFAAAAAAKVEMTVPELSQTVIITRMEGRTPVPPLENLKSLAAHRASLAIFLSASLVARVKEELLAGGYPADTPAVVAYRVSWPEEIIIRTTIGNLVEDIEKAGITRQAIIFVGDFLNAKDKHLRSKLYDGHFKHGYR